MPLARAMVRKGGVISSEMATGDLQATGRTISQLTTVGAGTWTAQMIASGIIRRTGPIAAYSDGTDTAPNIINALRGNAPAVESMAGTSFEMTFINTVGFAMSFLNGFGIIVGTQGASLNTPATTSANYLWTIRNSDPLISLLSGIANGSPNVFFVLPPGLTAFKIGPAPDAVNITPGAFVSCAQPGVPTNTIVTGLRMGQGGIIGVTLSNPITGGVNPQQVLTFSACIEVNSLYAG